uniref:Uncharacterized protein n=1 Tax=Parascaris equorum TaxID=6256 RepID=A0A914RWT6_PAREQ
MADHHLLIFSYQVTRRSSINLRMQSIQLIGLRSTQPSCRAI